VDNGVLKRIISAVQHVRAHGAKVECVAVGPRASRPAGTDAPVRPADIFNDNRLAQRSPHPLAKKPSDYIYWGACRIRHDQGDRSSRIGLCPSKAGCSRDRSGARSEMQKSTARNRLVCVRLLCTAL
jgi:hypothetical protein